MATVKTPTVTSTFNKSTKYNNAEVLTPSGIVNAGLPIGIRPDGDGQQKNMCDAHDLQEDRVVYFRATIRNDGKTTEIENVDFNSVNAKDFAKAMLTEVA